ncbi:MAG TPA: hypothetical protein VFC44_06090 [Candidatus Saccharimonadales bacterium]|nr:hypothetical protein [Candidatus Saccharimonadales bacterium]
MILAAQSKIRANGRKPRPPQGTFVRFLTPEQHEQIFQWLTQDNLSYAQAVARIQSEYGIKTNGNALSDFWRCHCAPRLLQWPTSLTNSNAVVLEVTLQVRANGTVTLRDGGKKR